MIDWIPIALIAFKVLVLGTGMFFAIKWHFDKETKEKKRAVLRASGKAVAVFLLLLLSLGFVTFFLATRLGLDLTFP
jgi:hypothetical protein